MTTSAPGPAQAASRAIPAASLPTLSRRPAPRSQASSWPLLTSTPTTRSIPCPLLVYGLAPTNRSGSEEQRGGITLRDGLRVPGFVPISDPARRPRAGVGAPPPCHRSTRQGSFGNAIGADWTIGALRPSWRQLRCRRGNLAFSSIPAALGFLRRFGQHRSRARTGASIGSAARGAPGMPCGFAAIPAALGFVRHFDLARCARAGTDPRSAARARFCGATER